MGIASARATTKSDPGAMLEVQRSMAAQNADVPQDLRIEFRFGIHVGDIIIDDNDIFGDGVNIAARLEVWLALVGPQTSSVRHDVTLQCITQLVKRERDLNLPAQRDQRGVSSAQVE